MPGTPASGILPRMRRTAVADPGVGSWIERRARSAPHQVALIAGSRPVTYAELATTVRRVANGLLHTGLRPGERVVWLGPNHPAFLGVLFATGLVGGVLAPVNHLLDPGAIADVLADTA